MSGTGDKPDAPPVPDLVNLATIAGEWVEAAEAVGAGILAAEVAALQAVMTPQPALTDEEKAARELAAEAKAEEDFDNMPL
jgi:hypothetical protein